MKSTKIQLRVSPENKTFWQDEAWVRGISLSDLIREAMDEYLVKEESKPIEDKAKFSKDFKDYFGDYK
jgi:predicted HicB family RNase H-like nuclease